MPRPHVDVHARRCGGTGAAGVTETWAGTKGYRGVAMALEAMRTIAQTAIAVWKKKEECGDSRTVYRATVGVVRMGILAREVAPGTTLAAQGNMAGSSS